mmetsp:Transcript_13075/g.40813  ORF Transcript_13075/g.40813 Transcript_13075/m.40813 type:complete len:213 (+) Transcript_13075:1281-1919(+)
MRQVPAKLVGPSPHPPPRAAGRLCRHRDAAGVRPRSRRHPCVHVARLQRGRRAQPRAAPRPLELTLLRAAPPRPVLPQPPAAAEFRREPLATRPPSGRGGRRARQVLARAAQVDRERRECPAKRQLQCGGAQPLPRRLLRSAVPPPGVAHRVLRGGCPGRQHGVLGAGRHWRARGLQPFALPLFCHAARGARPPVEAPPGTGAQHAPRHARA